MTSIYSLATIVVDDMLVASKPAAANDELITYLRTDFGIEAPRTSSLACTSAVPPSATSPYLRNYKSRKSPRSSTSPVQTLTPPRPKTTRHLKGTIQTSRSIPTAPNSIVACWGCSSTVFSPVSMSLSLSAVLAARIKNSKSSHVKRLKRVGSHLYATHNLRLQINMSHFVPSAELKGFCDASFDTCPDTSRSRNEGVAEFANCPIYFLGHPLPSVRRAFCRGSWICNTELHYPRDRLAAPCRRRNWVPSTRGHACLS